MALGRVEFSDGVRYLENCESGVLLAFSTVFASIKTPYKGI